MTNFPIEISPSRLLFIVGPTASGKTALGIALCQRLNGEIVSMDSMQIYRTLDIGTGKPSPEEQAAARHHLIDIREPYETYSAAQWAGEAHTAINDIRQRGKTPVIVGGTGFYARALLQPETLATVPPNPELRQHLEALLQEHDAPWLHNYLRELDPAAADRLQVNDSRRVIRAIEVAAANQPSVAMGRQSVGNIAESAVIFGLDWPRDRLYQRIEARIDTMLKMGFMDELKRLVASGTGFDTTAMQSLGYKQMLPALQDANVFDECLELWKRDTRRYAKRQMTWFRHQLPTRWLAIDEDTNVEDIVDTVVEGYQSV